MGFLEILYLSHLLFCQSQFAHISNLKIPYNGVDVNVHPTKKQIRFDNDQLIEEFVFTACVNSIWKDVYTPHPFKLILLSHLKKLRTEEHFFYQRRKREWRCTIEKSEHEPNSSIPIKSGTLE